MTNIVNYLLDNLNTIARNPIFWVLCLIISVSCYLGYAMSILPDWAFVISFGLFLYCIFDGLYLIGILLWRWYTSSQIKKSNRDAELKLQQEKLAFATAQYEKLNGYQKDCMCFAVLVGKVSPNGYNAFIYSTEKDSFIASSYLSSVAEYVNPGFGYDQVLLWNHDGRGSEWAFDSCLLKLIRDRIHHDNLSIELLKQRIAHPTDCNIRVLCR